MAFNSFKRKIWDAQLLVGLRNNTVSAAGVNHNHQALVEGASSVSINTFGSVTLKDYDGNEIVYDDVDTSEKILVLDNKKLFALKFDDIDMAQVADGGILMTTACSEAVAELVEDRDRKNFQCMADGAGRIVGSDEAPIAVSDYTTAKKVILKAKAQADKANVPADGRVLFIGPELENQLLADPTINLSAPTAETSLGAGHIGRLYGFNIFKTNNLPKTEGSNDIIIATHPKFTTEAIQINKTEALRSEKYMKDLVRGLCVSGRLVTMPEGIVKVIVDYTEE